MKHILIADDDIYIVESTRQMLAPYFAVDTARTGSEALLLFMEKSHYDGLITDVDFGPGMNGLELISRLRNYTQGCKIIVVSGIHYADAVRQQAIDMGAVFTERPLTLELVQRVMEA